MKSGRIKQGDSVRHIDGREGYILSQCEEGFNVLWVSGMPQPKPIKEGFLEKIKNGLTSVGGPK